jgi:hypothetical protein
MGRANGSRERAPDDRLRETHQSARVEAMGIASLHPSYVFASDATASISISIFGSGSACTTQVVRAG